MNPAPPPPPQPPQPHRPSTSCPRHPDEQFTGFCPSCLCERLTVLHPTTPSIAPARKSTSSTAAAALRSVFRHSSSSFFPELRRSKSFSASKNDSLPGAFEPQRKSCDVRVRLPHCNFFNQDNTERKIEAAEADSRNLASSSNIQVPKKEEEEEEENNEDVIIVLEEPEPNVCSVSEEIVEEEEEGLEGEDLKTMKDHIDLDSSQTKKAKTSFWSAATVFSKKLQKWRQKQKDAKKRRRDGALPAEKPTGRQFRETQSEVADYGFGRRSCDVDPRFSLDAAGPRFSLDAGRVSFDDPRYSVDEPPRGSLDGYLIGRAGFPRMPTMLSVVEDAPPVNVLRTDAQIPVEESPDENDSVPGGSAQTREYYSDSSSRRRKSLDRSNSARKREIGDELIRSVSNGSVIGNAKVTPAGGGGGGVDNDSIHGVKMGFQDRDIARDDCSSEVYGNGERKEEKKSRRWSIWGFIHRRGRNKDEDDEKCSKVNGVERSFSEDHLRGGGFGGRVWRSNSSVSWRNAQGFGISGSFGSQSQRRNINGVQGNGNVKKGKDEFVLERNRSARYSPSSVDNGLLRFYLTPTGGGGRRNGSVKSRANQTHSIARSVIGLY